MPPRLWSFEELARFTRFEDAEVRFWAADRLVHLYPDTSADALAKLLFDEHDATPGLVAGHLGAHGEPAHFPLLERGFRRGSGMLAAQCLAALGRLGYDGAPGLAREAIHRSDLSEESLAQIVGGLAAMATEHASEEGADAAREILLRRPELYAEPEVLEAGLQIFGDSRLGDLAGKWITALHFRGVEAAEPGIRVLHENLQMEEISWCIRTDRTGRIDLQRSLRAIENGHDCDLSEAIPESDRRTLSEAFSRGEFREMARTLATMAGERARAAAARSTDPGDTLPARLASLTSGFAREEVLTEADRLGHAMHTWLIPLLLSALVKTVLYRNLERECTRARGDLGALLELAETESSFLSQKLPDLLKEAAGSSGLEQLERWCAGTLEMRGPFFPKVIALETIGDVGLAALVPLVLKHLSDDNGYVFGAAERALSKLGDEAVEAARAEIERRKLHPDAMSSILVVLSDLMTPSALALAVDYFDEFMQVAGPEEGSELMALLGARAMIPHLRRWLERGEATGSRVAMQARVGHALLLVGAIHNVAIPEEERILQAIDEYWRESPDGPADDSERSGPYLM